MHECTDWLFSAILHLAPDFRTPKRLTPASHRASEFTLNQRDGSFCFPRDNKNVLGQHSAVTFFQNTAHKYFLHKNTKFLQIAKTISRNLVFSYYFYAVPLRPFRITQILDSCEEARAGSTVEYGKHAPRAATKVERLCHPWRARH